VTIFLSQNGTMLLAGGGAILLGAIVLLTIARTKPPRRPRLSLRQTQRRRFDKVIDYGDSVPAPAVRENKSGVADPGSDTMLYDPGKEFKTADASGLGRPVATLAVTDGPDRGRSFQIDRDVITVGRSGRRSNDIELSDATISREQARFVRDADPGGVRLINESATNPTKVNGQPVDSHLLKDGDTIQCGATVATFSFPAMA
jgi:hypothetical protein